MHATSNTLFTHHHSTRPNMHNVCCLILGGGQGSRLFPLTVSRCKPAICFGGRYRLIDVPLSNSINSHIQKIFVFTQFLASSLHRHIVQTYRTSTFSSGFIEVLGAEQKPGRNEWYQGTADAIRQNIEYLAETAADYFLVLSGDQLYNMNFEKMVHYAMQHNSDVVVAALPVIEKDAKRMGIMKVNAHNEVIDFVEKPEDPGLLDQFRISQTTSDALTFEKPFLASMGIYLFKRDILFQLLKNDPREDFGKHLIPTKVKTGGVSAFIYNGYWEDIGTIESFYKANIALTTKEPVFDCYDEANPIFTHRHHLPGPKLYNTEVNHSILCEGSIIEADEITGSILGQRTVIKKGSIIRDCYVMGNDFYQTPVADTLTADTPCIDENCIIRSAIIDKNVSIGKGVQLINHNKLQHYDGDNIHIRDGIIVVPRGARIPSGFIL